MAFKDYPLSEKVTGNDAWATLHTIYFQGTTALGTPTAMAALAGVVDAGAVLDLRVMDLTNNLVVAEKLGVTDAFPADVDMGSLTNLSAGLALWALQAKVQAGKGPGGDVAMGSLRLEM